MEDRPNALVVPSAAIQSGLQGSFVWMVNTDDKGATTAKMQPVKIALAQGQVTILDSGVKPGQKVVVDGADRLRQGASGGGEPGAAKRAAAQVAGAGPGWRPGGQAPAGNRGQATGKHQQQGAAVSLSPSRPFILRPVATSLLMAAILLAGGVGLSAVAGFCPARGGLPDHPGAHVLSRRRARGDGLVRDGAAGAAVRPDAGPEADDFSEFGRRLGDHARIQPGREHRCGRAGSAGGHQRGQQLSAQRSAQSAHLQQGEPGRRADHDAGADLRFPASGQD